MRSPSNWNENYWSQVMLGPYVVVTSGKHTKVLDSYRYGPEEALSITIGLSSWIGAHISIAGGANIGRCCVVGSNAAVIRDNIPDDAFAAGMPAVVKKIDENLLL
jgi:acetyltransferase-like isoleucine patch superfamily enzyme